MNRNLRILAIETALDKPSVSLLEGEKEIGYWVGESQISASSYLLQSIADFLKRTNFKLSELDLIAVSKGPGSFTGIRVGLATAQALAFGVHLKCCGVETLAALNLENNETKPRKPLDFCFAVIAAGSREVYWQEFSQIHLTDASSEEKREILKGVCGIEELTEKINKRAGSDSLIKIVADANSFEQLISSNFATNIELVKASDNAAKFVALATREQYINDELKEDGFNNPENPLTPLYFRDYRIGGR